MRVLTDQTLLKILQNEEKMEEYLQELGDKPSSIDPIIWQIHFSAPAKKRMPVLNGFFQQLLKKYSLVFSFLPEHMVLAKVYKILNIPFSVNSSKTSTVDVVSCKRPAKIARFNRHAKIYNSWRKTEKNSDLGIYEYNEERSGPFVSFAEFRKECNKKKSSNISATDVLNQLSKSKAKEKLVSNFASYSTQFSIKNSGQPTNSRISSHDTDHCAGKQTRTISTNSACNLLKKQALLKESGFKILKSRDRPRLDVQVKESSFKTFTSKDRPRLDVQVKTKYSDSASLAHPTTGNKSVTSRSYLKTHDFYEVCTLRTSLKDKDETVSIERMNIEDENTYSGSLLKIPKSPQPCILSTSSKNEDDTVLACRMDIDNCPISKDIQTEANVAVEETAVGQNSNNENNPNKFSGEVPNQSCSGESISVIQPTPDDEIICTSTSSEPAVIYSSNRSKNDLAFIEGSTRRPDSPSVTYHQLVPFVEERISAEFSNFNQSLASKKSSQSHDLLSSERSTETSSIKDIGDFDQLYERSPLKIGRKKNSTSLKKAKYSKSSSAFDRLYEEYENYHRCFEEWQTDGEEEKNKISDSENSIVSSKASPSLVYSVIYAQRSSESESEEIVETKISAVPSPTAMQKDESIDYIAAQPESDIVCISQEKTNLQSRNSTPEQSVSTIVSASQGKARLLLGNSTSKHSVSEKIHLQSRNSTPEKLVSEIISPSKELPLSQSKKSTLEQSVSKIMSAGQENPRRQSSHSTPEQPASEIVPATRENSSSPSKTSVPELPAPEIDSASNGISRSPSKNSTPEQSVLKIPTTSQEKSRSRLKMPTKKKTPSLNSSKAGKVSMAKTTEKAVKKLTEFVAFSVRKRHASNFELQKSDNESVGLRTNKSPISFESTSRSTSTWLPNSRSASSSKIRKVKKLFNESDDYLSASPVKEKAPAEDSSSSRIRKSPSPPKNTDRSEMEKSSDSDLSSTLPSAASAACYQSRGAKKLLSESEDSLMPSPSPTKKKPYKMDSDGTMCESLPFSEHTAHPEIEKSSDSDSSSIILSRDFKTLSLASKKSSILFPSQSPKMSPASTCGLNIQNSPASTVLNSQLSTEITLDQIDQMMEGIIPDGCTDSSFRFDLPSQFTFKESPNSENYADKFDASNFSDILASSSGALEKTLIAEESPDKYSVSNADEEAVLNRHSSNYASQDTSYPASRSTFNENFSSRYSSEMTPNTDIKEDSTFSIRESSIVTKKSKGFLSPNFNDGPPTRRHCLSLPVESKSTGQKKEPRKKRVDVVDIDDTSDEDVFRESSFKSLPTQLKKKTMTLSAQQCRRKYFQNKENQIGRKISQQNFKKVLKDSQKSPLSVTAKSCQFSNREKKKSPIPSQKSSQSVVIFDDEYESDELNSALNDSLTHFNKRKENEDVPESDAESTTSQYFDDDIARLLNEYAALNAEQQPLSLSSNVSSAESTTFMSTLSVKSNSARSNRTNRVPNRKPVIAGASNYKDIMWNSYPDSLETALTTPEEKLEEVRNNLREKVNNCDSQKLFSSQKLKSSTENENDSFGFLDWE